MKVVISPDGRYGHVEGSQAVFRLNARATGSSAGGAQPAAEPTSPQRKGVASGLISPWGDDNLFPQAVVRDIEKNTVLGSVLERKTATMFGQGLAYGTITGVEKSGLKRFEGEYLPEIEDFLEGSAAGRYAFEALSDVNTFANAFPELVLSKNRQKIVAISTQEACWTRYGVPKNGTVEYGYINANWDNGGSPMDELTTRVPLIDPYYDAVGSLKARTDGFKYLYPLSIPSPDKALYQLASWNAVRRSGWLDVAAAIPEFKKMLFKNQLSVKYLVEIHSAYWNCKYGDWDGLPQAERSRLLTEELTAFNNVMSGTNGAGKTVMSTTYIDKVTGKEFSAFKITAIDDKLKDGIYIEDSQEASSHIYTAVGYAPSLMGISPGKGMGGGAGGGSEPRVLFSNFISTAQFHMDLVLEPLNLIARYNGWQVKGCPVRFKFLPPLVMTEAVDNTPSADPKQQSK